MPSFRLRRATSKDFDLLVRHRHEMFQEMTEATTEELEATDRDYRGWVKDRMKRRLFHGYIVTTSQGEVAASGCVWLREIQPSPYHHSGLVPYVMSVYTSPEFRRNGLASMILSEAMNWARSKGYPKIYLHASTAGEKVYTKLGWKPGREMEFRFEYGQP